MFKVDYTQAIAPKGYFCSRCGATGVQLWRDTAPNLYCAYCSGLINLVGIDGLNTKKGLTTIGSHVPAVPAPDPLGWGYFGLVDMPENGLQWWNRLPLRRCAKTNAEVFVLLWKVIWMALEYADRNGCELEFRGMQIVPSSRQTRQGLYLELREDALGSNSLLVPGSLHTPWGEVLCWASGKNWSQATLSMFMSSLGAKSDPRSHGAVYSLSWVGEVDLPRAIRREPEKYRCFDEVEKEWIDLLTENNFFLSVLRNR